MSHGIDPATIVDNGEAMLVSVKFCNSMVYKEVFKVLFCYQENKFNSGTRMQKLINNIMISI